MKPVGQSAGAYGKQSGCLLFCGSTPCNFMLYHYLALPRCLGASFFTSEEHARAYARSEPGPQRLNRAPKHLEDTKRLRANHLKQVFRRGLCDSESTHGMEPRAHQIPLASNSQRRTRKAKYE